MIQGHMISFCCTIVKLCELKFQPSAHLLTNHSTDLQSRLQSYTSIKGQLIHGGLYRDLHG